MTSLQMEWGDDNLPLNNYKNNWFLKPGEYIIAIPLEKPIIDPVTGIYEWFDITNDKIILGYPAEFITVDLEISIIDSGKHKGTYVFDQEMFIALPSRKNIYF